ncbi:MAG TPA: polysaccharide deacetylase family protein [Thermoclostridium caenicola]|uniref:polysaccharide deacetylase family protein n=1 Tax=Thermoclostridium caenicola TaxID=659425 RepID=UPI002C387921|nr:polysaccharide deacetylase family protein [Thermoclostridium caenicola]HOK42635.1 polysaccharide deacetylase family protein [Thermoclostridium caenicola]HOL84148.1 polysaccharide deacetylase family protein [Thermoclostridium caenicola]HOP72746.1 polysaccharide deacetylase family protein [Thermoclostridium caenicola]HPO76180.1 polysaccharide deacetylase family protein [Thermoclostridium caenicola]
MDKRVKATLVVLITCLLVAGIVYAVIKTGPDPDISDNTTPTPGATSSVTPDPTLPAETPADTPEATEETTPEPVEERPGHLVRTDYENYQPNESGEIPIIMFHRFLEEYDGKDKEYTTTFREFEALLEDLYNRGFRLISMKDFIECNIDVPAGTMPMVFTFDDGTPGQFSLIEENGTLKVNPKSAVGILMAFNEKHPDFGLKGIFYVNMDIGDNTFKGAGTLKDRFEFLLEHGFELGTHTWGHINYKTQAKSAEDVINSLGKNQKAAYGILPDLEFYSLALPYGSLPQSDALKAYLREGTYEDIHYRHQSIMAVGSNPSKPSISPDYNPDYVPRIRSQGMEPVLQDLTWWLPKMTSDRMFVSDGDPSTIVVPEGRKDRVDTSKLNGKTLITY